jgi:hypothetical protein
MFRPVRSQVQNLRKLNNVIHKNESRRLKMQRDLVVILHDSIYNKHKIVNICKFYIFTILHFYNFTMAIDTTVQNSDNEISLHFKLVKLNFL